MIISTFIDVSNCSKDSVFFAKKCGIAKAPSFYPKTSPSAVNLKLPITTCLYSS